MVKPTQADHDLVSKLFLDEGPFNPAEIVARYVEPLRERIREVEWENRILHKACLAMDGLTKCNVDENDTGPGRDYCRGYDRAIDVARKEMKFRLHTLAAMKGNP